METMNYAALLPSRKVDWRATKAKGRAFALPLAALRGYRRAFTAWSHPLASPGSQFQNRCAKTGHRPSTWIDADHRRPRTRCQCDSHFNANCRSVLERTNASRTLLYIYAMLRQDGRRGCPDRRQRRDDRVAAGAAMKHAATRELFDYWNRRRGRRSAPARSNIDPADRL